MTEKKYDIHVLYVKVSKDGLGFCGLRLIEHKKDFSIMYYTNPAKSIGEYMLILNPPHAVGGEESKVGTLLAHIPYRPWTCDESVKVLLSDRRTYR